MIGRLYKIGFILLFLAACRKPENLAGTFKGPERYMGNGYIHAWVSADHFGRPKSIGFTMDAACLDNLPAQNSGHTDMALWELPLPREAHRTVFEEIAINWNHVGHIPVQFYGTAHFDFHFYMVPQAERYKIPVYPLDSMKFKNAPASSYFPVNYFYPGGGEPQMGAHWVDATSSEFQGQPFTQTFVYGSYDGKVNFLEPMVTYDFFKNTSDFSRSIPRPAKVQMTGYYPRTMHIYREDGKYTLALENMEYRTAE